MHFLSGNSLKIHPKQIRYVITPAINMEPENTGPVEIRKIIFQTIIFRFDSLIFGGVHPRKLTCQCKIHRLKMYFLLKMGIMSC